jgi:hypothetical protein
MSQSVASGEDRNSWVETVALGVSALSVKEALFCDRKFAVFRYVRLRRSRQSVDWSRRAVCGEKARRAPATFDISLIRTSGASTRPSRGAGSRKGRQLEQWEFENIQQLDQHGSLNSC